ncbi:MAG: hypothetical protein RLZZ162_2988, partial [Verrucomicrobiota bacterium]
RTESGFGVWGEPVKRDPCLTPNKANSSTEAVRRVNRITRGWSKTYHYGHSTRVFGRQQVWLHNRVRRWLWRRDDCTHGLFSFFTAERLLGHDQRWSLPRACARHP